MKSSYFIIPDWLRSYSEKGKNGDKWVAEQEETQWLDLTNFSTMNKEGGIPFAPPAMLLSCDTFRKKLWDESFSNKGNLERWSKNVG